MKTLSHLYLLTVQPSIRSRVFSCSPDWELREVEELTMSGHGIPKHLERSAALKAHQNCRFEASDH